MIRLQRERVTIPAKYRGTGLVKQLINLLEAWYDNGGDVPFKDKKYQIWKGAKDTLSAESAGKCAYCECATDVVAHGDVEHFRPKDKYWWLAYSYDNYTFCCQICNQSWKAANFPVSGIELAPPGPLPKARPGEARLEALAAALCPDPANDTTQQLRDTFAAEDADLPHPYLADPETLFAWEVDDLNREVMLVARGTRSASRRAAEAAVDFLGLNREELRRLRYPTYENIHAFCMVLQESSQAELRNLAEQRLRAAAASGSPFAGMTRHFLREWQVLA
jgi:hypothetical protein